MTTFFFIAYEAIKKIVELMAGTELIRRRYKRCTLCRNFFHKNELCDYCVAFKYDMKVELTKFARVAEINSSRVNDCDRVVLKIG